MNDLNKNNDPLMPGAPVQRPTISEVIHRARAENAVKPADPAPRPMQVHHEKMDGIVKAATTAVLDMGRQMRDELDEVLRVINERNDHLLEQIADHVGKTEGVAHNFKVMRDALADAGKTVANPTIISPPAKRNSGGKS